MARNHDTSESAPLLADRDANAGYASLDGTNDASSAGESAAIGSPVPPQAHAEEAGPNNEDEARAKQYEGMANARKQIPYILPAMGVGLFLCAADQTLVASSYGKIGSDLQALNNTSWVATSYFLTLTAFQPLYGKLSDIFGRKAALLWAYIIFGLGCVFCGLARNMTELIAARAFAGIGGGGMSTVVVIIMSDLVPLRERGTWQGILNIMYASGAGVGAPLGGLLADTIGWRWAFLGQGPLCLVAFLTVAVTLHLPRPKSEHWSSRLRRVDFPGALVLVSAVTLLLVGLDQGSNEGWSSPLVITCLALSVPTFATFLFVEHRLAAEPFAPSRIVFERSLFAAYMANFFSFGGWFFVMYYLPLYFQAAQDVSATTAGLRLMPGVCAGVLGSILGGLTLQRTGRYYWLTVAGYGLLAVASAAIFLAMGADAHNNIGIYVSLAIGGFGNGSGVTTSLVAIIAGAAPKDQAVATACSYLFRSLGSGMGLSVLSAIAQQLLRQRLKAELHDSVNVDWIVQNVRESLDFVRTLDPETQAIVRRTYGCTITSAFGVMVAVALMSCISAFFIREKKLSK